MLPENIALQKIQKQPMMLILNQLASNNWSTFLVIFFLLLAAYLPALHAYYLHTDDYFWSYWGAFPKRSVLMILSNLGRPLEGVLLCSLHLFKHLKTLNIVRFLSVLNLSCLAFLISYWLRINKVNALLSLIIAILIATLPPFQVYVAYISTAADGLSATVAMLALLLVHKATSELSSRKWIFITLAVVLLIASLALYQLAAFYYWAMLSVLVLTTDPQNFIKNNWKKMSIYFTIFVTAVLVYYAAWRFQLWYFQVPLGGRYDGRVFVQDPIMRLAWFFNGPLFEASNLWNINPSTRIAALIGTLTILGAASDFFKKDYFCEKTSVLAFYSLIFKIIFLLSFFPATFIIALASSDPSAQYRTYLCLASLFICFSLIGLHRIICSLMPRKLVATCFFSLLGCTVVYSIYMANNIITNYFVLPDSFEVHYVQSEVLRYQKEHPNHLERVHIIIVNKAIAPQERGEIGEPTLRHTPNVRPMVWAALSDLKLNNLHVSFAANVKDHPWLEYTRNYDGYGNLPVLIIQADNSHTAVVDLSHLGHA